MIQKNKKIKKNPKKQKQKTLSKTKQNKKQPSFLFLNSILFIGKNLKQTFQLVTSNRNQHLGQPHMLGNALMQNINILPVQPREGDL